MNKKEIEFKIQDLKMEYVRLQNDLEKLEFAQGNLAPIENQIAQIEADLKLLYIELDKH